MEHNSVLIDESTTDSKKSAEMSLLNYRQSILHCLHITGEGRGIGEGEWGGEGKRAWEGSGKGEWGRNGHALV